MRSSNATLPEEWTETSWGELIELVYGKGIGERKSATGSAEVFGTNGPTGDRSEEAQGPGPTVVIGRKGAYRGVHWAPGPFWVIDTAFYVRLKADLDLGWVFRALSQVDINGLDSGSAIPSTRREDVYHLRTRVPPLEEQRRISRVLGVFDGKIESNRLLTRTLDEIAAALFKARFVDFVGTEDFEESEIGPIPRGWDVGTISDLCEFRYGYTASAASEPVGPKFVRVMDINKQPWIDWDSVPYCEIDPEKKDRFGLKVGDIVVARMADPGKAALVEEEVDAVAASYLVRLRPRSLAEAYYLLGFLRSAAYVDYCRATMSGSVQKNMNAKVITGAKLPIPPDDQIQAHLDSVLPIRRRLTALLRESASVSAIRDALSPRLVSGRIRVSPLTDSSPEVV